MEKIMDILFTISLGYLFAFPIFLVLLKFDSKKELEFKGKKVAASMLSIVTIAIFSFSDIILTDGEIASYFILFWFIVLIPTAICFYIFIEGFNRHYEKEYTEKRKQILGFQYRTALLLALSLIFAFSLVLHFTISSCNTVLNYHDKLVNEIVSSKNPKELLYEETSQPSYMFDGIITDINQIKDNKAYVNLALPWRVEITVETQDKSKYWELDYVRNNNNWRLEGLHRKFEIDAPQK